MKSNMCEGIMVQNASIREISFDSLKKAVRRVFHHVFLCCKEMGKQALRFTKQDFKPELLHFGVVWKKNCFHFLPRVLSVLPKPRSSGHERGPQKGKMSARS